jgi:hypothetical protein
MNPPKYPENEGREARKREVRGRRIQNTGAGGTIGAQERRLTPTGS